MTVAPLTRATRWMTTLATCALCTSPAMAQDTGGGAASIETGASYSSLRGAFVFLGLRGEDIMGSGTDVSLGYQAGEGGKSLNAAVRKTFSYGNTALGLNTTVDAALFGRASDWDIQDYAAEHYKATLTASAETAAGLRYSARAFWQSDSIDDLDASISPLITTLDSSTAVGLGVGLGYSTFTGRGPLATGIDLSTSFAIATSAGDREWSSAELTAQYNAPLPGGLVLALRGEAGQIAGRNGDDVNVVDRAFLGNPAPRGFAYAGLGPRDAADPNIDTPLGGNSYLTSTVELRMGTPNPDITIGAFADAGALWDLDQIAGGASGTIDDSYDLRTSVGVSVYWDTPIGLMQLNVANPIDKRDGDQTEEVSLNLNFAF